MAINVTIGTKVSYANLLETGGRQPMTADEWETSTDPQRMLEAIKVKASERKLKLLAYGIERYRGNQFASDREYWSHYWPALETHENNAEGGTIRRLATEWMTYPNAAEIAVLANADTLSPQSIKADLLRCVFGNPFWPAFGWMKTRKLFDPQEVDDSDFNGWLEWIGGLEWNNSTIPKLAERIYEERAFGDLPILCDALEEADCKNEDILRHCRTPGVHVRGCWVTDLILGKE